MSQTPEIQKQFYSNKTTKENIFLKKFEELLMQIKNGSNKD